MNPTLPLGIDADPYCSGVCHGGFHLGYLHLLLETWIDLISLMCAAEVCDDQIGSSPSAEMKQNYLTSSSEM